MSDTVFPEGFCESDSFFASLAVEAQTHAALRHPFLRRFAEEPLRRDQLAAFATQHYLYSRHFTQNLAAVVSRVPDENARNLLIANLHEEIGEPHRVRDRLPLMLLRAGEISSSDLVGAFADAASGLGDDLIELLVARGALDSRRAAEFSASMAAQASGLTHAALFRRFLHAVGVDGHIAAMADPLPETTRMIETYRQLCRSAPWLEALGAMGPGTECVVASLYRPIEQGIASSGLVSPDAYVFWTLHVHCDDGHGTNIVNALRAHATSAEGRASIAAGARTVLEARRQWFDGLERLVFRSTLRPSARNDQRSTDTAR